VPDGDERSNVRMIREALTEHVPVRRRNVHAMAVMSDDPAGAYEAELRRVVGAASPDAAPELDFVLLGMGGDAHTASLFPGSPVIGVRDRLVAVNDGPGVTPPARVTMTYPLLNAAREVAVLVTGANKAAALRRVAEQCRRHGPDPDAMPITGIDADGLTWYVDEEAVG
jgi:6-phosphogluconolactonase